MPNETTVQFTITVEAPVNPPDGADDSDGNGGSTGGGENRGTTGDGGGSGVVMLPSTGQGGAAGSISGTMLLIAGLSLVIIAIAGYVKTGRTRSPRQVHPRA